MSARRGGGLPGPGDAFPAVVGLDWCGRSLELTPNSAVIVFFRGHWCGHCREQLVALARESQAFFAAGFRLIAISADDVEGCGRLRAATDGAIAIVSDPGAGFIMDLELTTTDPMVEHLIALPAVFVVDDTGVVRYRYLSRSPDDRPKTALLLLAVERLASAAPKASSRL